MKIVKSLTNEDGKKLITLRIWGEREYFREHAKEFLEAIIEELKLDNE